MNSERKNILAASREILRVVRPDIQSIKKVRYFIWIIAISTIIILFTKDMTRAYAHPIFYVSFAIILLLFIAVMNEGFFNIEPIIIYEDGISQKRVQSLLWTDIEAYYWVEFERDFLMLKFTPSNTMPVSLQMLNMKWAFSKMHISFKEELEKIFVQKGMRVESW